MKRISNKKNKKKMTVKAGTTALAVVMAAAGGAVYCLSPAATAVTGGTIEQNNAAGAKSPEKVLKDIIRDAADTSSKSSDMTNGKEETVYLIANASGKTTQTIVSDWLKNGSGKSEISDTSNLTDIENVKGNEKFTQNGDQLTWQAEGNDIYYQGKTEEESPIQVKVTYYLDGKEISPEQLAGKSGKVKIRLDYTNKAKKTVKEKGKDYDVYVPFTVISGLLLDNDKFSNIEVENGKAISNGSRSAVIGYAFPGLEKSLDVTDEDFKKDIDIPDYVEVTADVKDFSLDMTMTCAMPDIMSDLNFDKTLDTSELDDVVDDLSDASGKLADGASALYKGAGKVSDGAEKLSAGTGTLANGTSALQSGAGTLRNGTKSLDSGASKLASGTAELSSGAGKFSKGTQSLRSGISAYTSGVTKLKKGIETLKSKTSSLPKGVKELAEGATKVQGYFEGEDGLVKGAGKLDSGVNSLYKNLSGGATEAEQKKAYQAAAAQVNTAENKKAVKNQVDSSVSKAMASAVSELTSDQTGSEIAAGVKQGYSQAFSSSEYKQTVAAVKKSLMSNAGLTEAQADAAVAAMQKVDQGTVDKASDQVAAGITASIKKKASSASIDTDPIAEKLMSTLADTAGKSAAGAVDSTKKSVAAGIKSGGLVEGTAKLSKGIDQLYQEGIQPLSGGLKELNQSAPALMSGINQLNSGAGELTGNNRKLNSGADTLAGSAKQLAGGAEKVNTGVITLKNGTGKLDTGALSLFKGASKLNQGTVTLKKGAASLASGSRQVTDGAGKLSKNLTKLDQEGIKKLVDSYNGDVKELVNHMEAVRDAGEAYKTFTRLSNHMDGKVKFIIRTDSVTTDSDNN